MNKNLYRIVFSQRRGQLLAVAETASSSSKSPSGTSKARRRSSKCPKTAKSDGFILSKVPQVQWIRAQAAPFFIVFASCSAAAFVTNPATARAKAMVKTPALATPTSQQAIPHQLLDLRTPLSLTDDDCVLIGKFVATASLISGAAK